VAGTVTRAFGMGPTTIACMGLWSATYVSAALIGPSAFAALLLGLAMVIVGPINSIASANNATLRQVMTPEHVLGRVMAVSRVSVWGGVAVGSILGGLLAEQIGLRPTIALGGALPFIGGLVMLWSPLKRVRGLDSIHTACSSES
jgi:predicted MFS family arabinose efflux permease